MEHTSLHKVESPLSMKKVILFVPAFNEESTIFKTVETLQSLKDKVASRGYELSIIVINDGSQDKTEAEAKRAKADQVINHKVNKGLGAAVRTGLMAARDAGATIAVKFDADLQHEPTDVLRMIEPLEEDTADIVYGHRFNKIEYKMPFVRRMGNRVFTGLMRWLTGWKLKDSQPGIFAVNHTYLSIFRIPRDYNYTQQVLLDAACKRMRFQHVDVSFRARTQGQSFVSFKYPIKVLPQLFWVLVGIRPLKVFGPVSTFFIAIASGVFLYQWILFLKGVNDVPVQNVNFVMGVGLFGLQILLFGILADLIVEIRTLLVNTISKK